MVWTALYAALRPNLPSSRLLRAMGERAQAEIPLLEARLDALSRRPVSLACFDVMKVAEDSLDDARSCLSSRHWWLGHDPMRASVYVSQAKAIVDEAERQAALLPE